MRVQKFPQRRRTRSLLIGSLAVAVAVVAAACSSGGGSGGSGGSGGGKTTLKIITWVNPPAVQAINKIDAEFEKANPNITVKLQTAANVNGPYETLLQQSVNSGTADIVTSNFPLLPLPKTLATSNTTPIQLYVTKGAFAPLNGQSFLSDYTTAAQQAETYQGKTYGLVSGAYQEGVFYNKQIFAKYHLTPPTTFSQFLALCQTLKAPRSAASARSTCSSSTTRR
jgi:raffinose/stachyose/melibiose transport system substrate-binding protein